MASFKGMTIYGYPHANAQSGTIPATLWVEWQEGGGPLAVITPPTETRPALLYAPEQQL